MTSRHTGSWQFDPQHTRSWQFDPLDAATVYVCDDNGTLWLEHGPFGTVPPGANSST